MLSGANAFEISDIERMNIGARQDVTMLHALWLPEITIRQGSGIPGVVCLYRTESAKIQ